ncbi:MAG: PilZ domain-containing protein [Pseudomonadota bacterium]
MTVNTTRVAQRLAAIAAQPPVSVEAARPSPGDGRTEQRRLVYRFARIVLSDRSEVDCIVSDLSVRGARIELESALALPQAVKLKIVLTGQTRRARVAWQRDRAAGLSFSLERQASFASSSSAKT